jgi:hypothetical protein
MVATSHLCHSRRSRPHPAKGPENHVFAIMISQNSQKKRRHAATIDACAITRSPQITHFVFRVHARMREERRGFRRNFFLPVSADSFLPVTGEFLFRHGRGRRAARLLANATRRRRAAWIGTPTARRNLPHIPKFVEFVLGEPRRRDGHFAAADRTHKCITILMQSQLRLALARVHSIHAIQAARRAECPNSTLRSWAPTTILW